MTLAARISDTVGAPHCPHPSETHIYLPAEDPASGARLYGVCPRCKHNLTEAARAVLAQDHSLANELLAAIDLSPEQQAEFIANIPADLELPEPFEEAV